MMMQCSMCGKLFAHGNKQRPSPMQNHNQAKHQGQAQMVEPQEDDEEESMASRHIQATLDEAMGIGNPDREWML